jgi:predicted nucleic acid-binding protein
MATDRNVVVERSVEEVFKVAVSAKAYLLVTHLMSLEDTQDISSRILNIEILHLKEHYNKQPLAANDTLKPGRMTMACISR